MKSTNNRSNKHAVDEFIRNYLKEGYGYYTDENARFSKFLLSNRSGKNGLLDLENQESSQNNESTATFVQAKGLNLRATSAFDSNIKSAENISKVRTKTPNRSTHQSNPDLTKKQRKDLQFQQFKTSQVVYETDKTGRRRAKLKEPRNLYSIDAEFSDSPTKIRYPYNFGIIKSMESPGEPMFDMNKRPAESEGLYKKSGNELTPRIGQSGRMIYYCDNGEDDFCFRKSSVDGKQVRPDDTRLKAQYYNEVQQKCAEKTRSEKLSENNNRSESAKIRPIPPATTPEVYFSTPPLIFEARFESGNLKKVVRSEEFCYELELRPDLYSAPTQWYLFRVENAIPGQKYRFTIVNLYKKTSLYNQGMKPLIYTAESGWVREGDQIIYYKNSKKSDQEKETTFDGLYSLTWVWQLPTEKLQKSDQKLEQKSGQKSDKKSDLKSDQKSDLKPDQKPALSKSDMPKQAYFAHCYPYQYSDLKRYIFKTLNQSVAKIRLACQSVAQNPVYIITITGPNNLQKNEPKPIIVLTGRVHPGETNASWMMKGVLDFLTSDDPIAVQLRSVYVFKIMPMINPDGVVVGNYRRSLTGRDMNRNYRTILSESFPSIYSIKRLLKRLNTAPREIVLYTDFHGHNRKNNIFIYGCTPTEQHRKETKPMPKQSKQERFSEKVFPYLLQQKCPDLFSFNDCKFNIQKSKEGTGRIVAWRSGIVNAYTIEASFCGTKGTSRKDTHLSITDLENMGKKFCEALHEFSKEETYSKTLDTMQEMTRKRVVEKVIYNAREKSHDIGDELYDKLMDTVDIEQVDNSDIESDTEGSDSSDDDGLPTNINSSSGTVTKPKTKSKQVKTLKSKTDFRRKLLKSKERSIAFEKVSSVLNADLKKIEAGDSTERQGNSFVRTRRRIVQSNCPKINRPRQELKISKIERVSTLAGDNVISEVPPERPTNFEWPKDAPDAEKSRNTFRSPAIVQAEEFYPNINQQHTLNVLYQYPRTLGSVRNSVHSLIQNQLDMMKSDIDRSRASTIQSPLHWEHTTKTNRKNDHHHHAFSSRMNSATERGINCNLTKRERDHRNNANYTQQLPDTKFYGKSDQKSSPNGNKQVFYSASPTLYKPDFPEDDEVGFMTGNFNNHMLPGKHKFRYSMPLEYNDSKYSDPRAGGGGGGSSNSDPRYNNKKYNDMNYNDINYNPPKSPKSSSSQLHQNPTYNNQPNNHDPNWSPPKTSNKNEYNKNEYKNEFKKEINTANYNHSNMHQNIELKCKTFITELPEIHDVK